MQFINPLYKLLSILILLVILSGCSGKSDNKVGLLLHNMEGRWYTDIEFLNKYANEAGLELVVKVADGDENKQLQQAEELSIEGVGVMLVVPVNQHTAAGIVRTAHRSGIQVIAYDRIIANSDLDYLISFEYKQIGQMIAEYCHNKVPKGNYVILWGDASDNNAQLMRKGQEEFLKPFIDRGDIKIIYRSHIDGWSDIVAAHTMQKVLDFSDQQIDVVMASNDNIALAALNVYTQNGIKKPAIVTGQDAVLDACKSILNNEQTMSVYKSTNQMAKEAIELAKNILQGKVNDQVKSSVNNNRKDVPALFLKPIIVDKGNLYNIITNDGMYSKEELMKN